MRSGTLSTHWYFRSALWIFLASYRILQCLEAQSSQAGVTRSDDLCLT
jgi:hypothetical protein